MGIKLDFTTSCGKGMFHEHDPHDNMPTTERILVILMQSFLGKVHILFTYKYYTSLSLAIFLLEKKTHLCDTIRTNHKLYSKEICSVSLEGTAAFYKASGNHSMLE